MNCFLSFRLIRSLQERLQCFWNHYLMVSYLKLHLLNNFFSKNEAFPINHLLFTNLPFVDNMRKVQHSKHPIHPCIASQKESESNSSIDGIEGKTRVQKKPIIVRSSYFQHKNLEENNQENTKMNDSKDDDDDDVAVASKNTCSDGVHVSVFHAPEVKTRVENRKMITSRYFSQKNQENTNEKSTIKRKFSISEDSVQKVGILLIYFYYYT